MRRPCKITPKWWENSLVFLKVLLMKKIRRIQVLVCHYKISNLIRYPEKERFSTFSLRFLDNLMWPQSSASKIFSVQVHLHKRRWFMYVSFWPRAVATLIFIKNSVYLSGAQGSCNGDKKELARRQNGKSSWNIKQMSCKM